MARIFAVGALVALFCFVGSPKAFAQFDVDWGVSWDNGQTGWQQIGQYLYDNAYFSDLNEAKSFAKNQYIDDPDPYWFAAGSYSADILLEAAGFADQNTFGYYTGTGVGKSLTQLFAGPDGVGDSTLFDPSDPFGFYLMTPQDKTWFTDRSEHADSQSGFLKDTYGNTQVLLYALPGKTPGIDQFLVAAEDLNAASFHGSDNDYNDMWVLVSRTTVVPEPVSSALFLLGGGAMAALRMRKKRL